MFKTNELYTLNKIANHAILPFSTVDKQKNPIYGVTKPFFGFLCFLKCGI